MKFRQKVRCCVKDCEAINCSKNPVNKRRTNDLQGILMCENHLKKYLYIKKKQKFQTIESINFINHINLIVESQKQSISKKYSIEMDNHQTDELV